MKKLIQVQYLIITLEIIFLLLYNLYRVAVEEMKCKK